MLYIEWNENFSLLNGFVYSIKVMVVRFREMAYNIRPTGNWNEINFGDSIQC